MPGRGRLDLVIVGTEAGDVVALDEADGATVWRTGVGAAVPGGHYGCSAYPDQVFGVTGSPVVDRAAGRVYAVGGDDRVHALALATGAPVAGWAAAAVGRPAHEHVWGALTQFGGRLYAATASYCDQPPWTGAIVAVDARSGRRVARFVVAREPGRPVPSGGGVWGWGGVSVDPSDGDVFAATGNAYSRNEYSGVSESVVRLSANLRVLASNHPYASPRVIDDDFGATPLLYDPPGCPPQLAALNKNGYLYVYRRDALARGPVHRLRIARPQSNGTLALLGLPAYDAARRTLYVVSPSDPRRGLRRRGLLAFAVGPHCGLRLRWHDAAPALSGLSSPPMAAGGVVYVVSGVSSRLLAVSAATGRTLRSLALGQPQAFAAPTPVNGAVITGGWDGNVRLFSQDGARPRERAAPPQAAG